MKKAEKVAKKKQLYNDMVGPEEYKRPPARLNIAATDLPDIKSWDVGETYKLTLTAKMISKSEGGWNGKQPLEGTFEITKASNNGDTEEGE